MSVAQILTYFFDRLGIVNDEELQAKESESQKMAYGLTEPILTIFDESEELQDLGAVAQNYYSDMQFIKVALQIINNTGEFEKDIRLWNAMLRADKTLTNLKDHFEHAHQSLRSMRGKLMRSTSYQNTNMLTIHVLAEVKAVKEGVLQAMEEQQPDENTSPEQHTYSATNDNVQELKF